MGGPVTGKLADVVCAQLLYLANFYQVRPDAPWCPSNIEFIRRINGLSSIDEVQRIVFDGEPGQWWLDGKRIGQGSRVSWAPWPGRHELALVGRDGAVVETVRFEVRGAGVKATPAARMSWL